MLEQRLAGTSFYRIIHCVSFMQLKVDHNLDKKETHLYISNPDTDASEVQLGICGPFHRKLSEIVTLHVFMCMYIGVRNTLN